MANTTQKVTAALAVSATLLTARAASATDIPVKATIVLHVDNFASLPSETLSQAEKAVTAIFADAGVILEWVDGRERRAATDSGTSKYCSCHGTWANGRSRRTVLGRRYSVKQPEFQGVPTSSRIAWRNSPSGMTWMRPACWPR